MSDASDAELSISTAPPSSLSSPSLASRAEGEPRTLDLHEPSLSSYAEGQQPPTPRLPDVVPAGELPRTLDIPDWPSPAALVLAPSTHSASPSLRLYLCLVLAVLVLKVLELASLGVAYNQLDAFAYVDGAGYTITVASHHYANVSSAGQVVFDDNFFTLGQSPGTNFSTPAGYVAASNYQLSVCAAVLPASFLALFFGVSMIYDPSTQDVSRPLYTVVLAVFTVTVSVCCPMAAVFMRSYRSMAEEGGAVSSEILAAGVIVFIVVGLECLQAVIIGPVLLWQRAKLPEKPSQWRRDRERGLSCIHWRLC